MNLNYYLEFKPLFFGEVKGSVFIASQNGHLEVTKCLVEAGADIDKAREDGITPIGIAAHNSH